VLAEPQPVACAPMPLLVAPTAAPCGFPSPAQDYPTDSLDLSERLIRDRAATYIWRASGESMVGAGIFNDSLLLVDRGLTPVAGHIVVGIVDGEYTVKYLDRLPGGQPVLRAANPHFPDIVLDELSELTIWGVVTWVLSKTV